MDDRSLPHASADGLAPAALADPNPITAEQHVASIVEFLPDATFAVDSNKRVVVWNHACEVLTGVSRQAMLGQSTAACAEAFFGQKRPILIDRLELQPPDADALYERVERRGDVIEGETYSGHVNGGRGAYLRGTALRLFDGEGRRCGAVEVVRDASDVKVMEDALRNRETQLSLILNNVSDVIFAVAVEADGGFHFASVNRRFLEATGLAENQVVGAAVRDVIPEAAHQMVFGKYREAIATGQPMHWEEVSEYPSGVKVGHVTVVPVYDAHGVCTQLVGMVHDVSERKQAEEQVRQLNEDLRRHADVLEQRVQSRTAQLAARNQELKDFAYTVSHDLKAPLRGIAGYANELSRKHSAGLGERARFCLSQIVSAATNLDRLIEDLLHYSRLDAETPSPTDVNPRELVEAVLRDRQLAITEQHVDVTVDVPSTTVRAWERGLVQVLTNLIDNALKYSRHANPPRLRIAATCVGDEWRLSVTDNGIGFDMKYADRIFGLFNRLVRMEDYEGTGAGLAIVKKVIDKQGGRIWTQSAPGEGATFFAALPLAPRHD